MPFLFPHSFMPPVPGVGFAPPPSQSASAATIDLTAGSMKRGSRDSVMEPSKITRHYRVA